MADLTRRERLAAWAETIEHDSCIVKDGAQGGWEWAARYDSNTASGYAWTHWQACRRAKRVLRRLRKLNKEQVTLD